MTYYVSTHKEGGHFLTNMIKCGSFNNAIKAMKAFCNDKLNIVMCIYKKISHGFELIGIHDLIVERVNPTEKKRLFLKHNIFISEKFVRL